MQADIFKDILVPVIGGLGIFMLGLEFMSNGIQNLAVKPMRQTLARVAGTPITGLAAGTLITGVIQSSTAMTVMVVGLVNAGVLGLRPAVSVIMGANIGTTLGNGLIALPLGPLGLILGGIFALIYVFAQIRKVKNIALACMGFALIFYGLNLMTGGLRPLRNMPEVMSLITSLKADNYIGLIWCVLIAAIITAMIHSSSATIGIVMGLGAAGVLDWQTAVAFSLGADLGTTITSWMASMAPVEERQTRGLRAHNVQHRGRRRDVAAVLRVHAAAGLGHGMVRRRSWRSRSWSTARRPSRWCRWRSASIRRRSTSSTPPSCSRSSRVRPTSCRAIGHSSAEDKEDYSRSRDISSPAGARTSRRGSPPCRRKAARYLEGVAEFLAIARSAPKTVRRGRRPLRGARRAQPRDPGLHRGDAATEHAAPPGRSAGEPRGGRGLDRKSRRDALPDRPSRRAPEVRRPTARSFSTPSSTRWRRRCGPSRPTAPTRGRYRHRRPTVCPRSQALRDRCLKADLPWAERGAILTLLGSAERAFYLIERIDAERRSVSRVVPAAVTRPGTAPDGLGSAVPAE